MNGYKEFQQLLKQDFYGTMKHFKGKKKVSMKETAGKINRITARMKFVKKFQEVKVKQYSKETMSGYNGIFQTFLAYSAFEGFIQLFPEVDKNEVEKGFPKKKYKQVSKKILQLDKGNKFLDSLQQQVTNHTLKNRIIAFQKGEKTTPLVIAKSIRHIFAHGKLTPNANDANPEKVAEICSLLSNLMLEIMDKELSLIHI